MPRVEVPSPPDEAETIGRVAPDVELIDEGGETFRLRQLEGHPVIISPIFTSCPHTCAMITSSLRDALAGIDGLGESYHVLTLSFDEADTPRTLREFRERHELPPAWRTAIAEPETLSSLLSALDFRYVALDGGGFAHPNLVAVIDANRVVSGYVHGVHYETEDVRRVLASAWTGGSLVRRYRGPIAVVMGIGVVATLLVIVLAGRRRQARDPGEGPAA